MVCWCHFNPVLYRASCRKIANFGAKYCISGHTQWRDTFC
uniref:Uncharacterized protein n=1 Tax=Anguilla anguilla TaxID=7936 RepID=A0A0E9PMA5_ANGAN